MLRTTFIILFVLNFFSCRSSNQEEDSIITSNQSSQQQPLTTQQRNKIDFYLDVLDPKVAKVYLKKETIESPEAFQLARYQLFDEIQSLNSPESASLSLTSPLAKAVGTAARNPAVKNVALSGVRKAATSTATKVPKSGAAEALSYGTPTRMTVEVGGSIQQFRSGDLLVHLRTKTSQTV